MILEPAEPGAERGPCKELKTAGDRLDPDCRPGGILEPAEFSQERAGSGSVGQSGQFGKPPGGQWLPGEKQGGFEPGEFLRTDELTRG